MRQPGGASGANNPEADVPVAMDPRHALGEGPSRSPALGWALDIHEAELSFEPPPSPANISNGDNLWVQLTPQGHAYADHGSQVNQGAAATRTLRTTDPPHGRKEHWEQHGGSPATGPSSRRTKQGPAWR